MRLKQYWVALCVKLHEPLDLIDADNVPSDNLIHGYFISIGVTSESEESVRKSVKKMISDGKINWNDSTVEPTDFVDLDLELEDLSGDPYTAGVWYTSGKAFFSDDVPEDEVPL